MDPFDDISTELVKVLTPTHVEGVAVLQLNRPQKRNAFTQDMIDAMVAALDSLDKNKNVRALVVTSTPNSPFSGVCVCDTGVSTLRGYPLTHSYSRNGSQGACRDIHGRGIPETVPQRLDRCVCPLFEAFRSGCQWICCEYSLPAELD